MKLAHKIGMNLLVLMLLSSVGALFAQTPAMPVLKFALEIVEKPLEAENTPGTHILLVKYTNLSDSIQRDPCVGSPSEYKLVVLRDGMPVENRYARKKKTEETEESQHPGEIRLKLGEKRFCGVTEGFKPGQIVRFPLWVSSQYDMTVPGTYDITVTRETDRWNPEKNVTIKSNTLTIVVPEPGAVAPQ
jgi:hypothetical protein